MQHELPLGPGTGDLPFTPITYCNRCGVVVAVNEAQRTNTHDYCTLQCKLAAAMEDKG